MSGIYHLALNVNDSLSKHVGFCRDKEHVVVVQGYVAYGSGEDAMYVHAYHAQGQVLVFTVHNGSAFIHVLAQAVSRQQQGADRVNVLADFVYTFMLYCAPHFHLVAESCSDTVNLHHIFVGEGEGAHAEFINGVYAVLVTRFACYA